MSAYPLSNDIAVRVADRVAASIGPRRYAMWFDRSARFDVRDGGSTLGVTVPNRFVADWIGRHFQDDLRDAARATLGHDVDLAVEVEAAGFPPADTSAACGLATPPATATPPTDAPATPATTKPAADAGLPLRHPAG